MANMKIYGVPFSQPVRAVLWLLLMKRQSFELVMVNPGSSGENGSRHPDYLKMNPAGTIPCLLESDTGFSVGESHAIMTYMADKYDWSDVYGVFGSLKQSFNDKDLQKTISYLTTMVPEYRGQYLPSSLATLDSLV